MAAFMENNKKLMEAYYKVFDVQGNVRACGREVCSKLIEACEEDEDMIYFGNALTGEMNVEAIKNYILYGKGWSANVAFHNWARRNLCPSY